MKFWWSKYEFGGGDIFKCWRVVHFFGMCKVRGGVTFCSKHLMLFPWKEKKMVYLKYIRPKCICLPLWCNRLWVPAPLVLVVLLECTHYTIEVYIILGKSGLRITVPTKCYNKRVVRLRIIVSGDLYSLNGKIHCLIGTLLFVIEGKTWESWNICVMGCSFISSDFRYI